MSSSSLGPIRQLQAGRLPRRLVQLFAGLVLYGVSSSLLIRSGLGMVPWDVLHAGLSAQVGLAIGTVTILVSVLVLLLWIPLRQQPGLGTVANAIMVGATMNVVLLHLPAPETLAPQIAFMVGGIVLNGAATALYIGASLGPGPRDGLMTGLHDRTGVSLRLARTGIEVAVVIAGILLGGVFGVGTILYAFLVGPLTQLMLPWFTVPPVLGPPRPEDRPRVA